MQILSSPPPRYAHKENIDTNSRDRICINVNRLLQKIPNCRLAVGGTIMRKDYFPLSLIAACAAISKRGRLYL